MPKSQKYESQLHIGLMAIIFVLLLLCTVSNFMLYKQRGVERGRVEKTLQDLAISAAKQLDIQSGAIPDVDLINHTRIKLNLTTLTIMPYSMSVGNEATWPENDMPTRYLKKGDDGVMSLMLLSERVGQLQEGDSAEFLMLNQIAAKGGLVLVVAGSQFPEYQMLIQASDVLFYASVAGLLLLGLLYKTVTKVITAPFERLKRNAERAGRVDKDGADIESIISDYEKLVAELRERETELKGLNQLHQQKADTLENFSRYLMKSLVSGVITLDHTGTIRSLNHAATDLLGLDGSEWVSRNISELPRYCDPITRMVRSAEQTGNHEPYRELNIIIDASKRSIIGVTVSAVYDADESCIGYSILLYDLEEISRLRTELNKREQLAALGEMAAGLAHQLRNALGSALGYSRLVEKKIRADAGVEETLDKLGDELVQTEQLVSRFLDFARPLNAIRDSLDVEEFMTELIEGFKVRESCRLIRFDVQLEAFVEVMADALLLKQAITNLVENAVKSYNGTAGTVAISARSSGGRICIEISDNGDGIEPDNLDKVFLPFFSTRTDGTGLGLPLAKKIVDLHNGELVVRSVWGKGTTVQVVLPASGVPIQRSAALSIS
jgi:PAS domain S-box-containing protein